MEATIRGLYGRVDLGSDVLTIGRAPDNQLVLDDPQVSGHHAEIRQEGTRHSIIDLGSTNGTFVNDYRLTPNAPRSLYPNDRVLFGQHRDNPSVQFTYGAIGTASITPTYLTPPPSQPVPPQGHPQAPAPQARPQSGVLPAVPQTPQSAYWQQAVPQGAQSAHLAQSYQLPVVPPAPQAAISPAISASTPVPQESGKPRPGIRDIISGQTDYKPSSGMSEKDLADLLAPLTGNSASAALFSIKAGEALGKALHWKVSKQVQKAYPAPHEYTAVVLAFALAFRHGEKPMTSLYDTARGCVVESKISGDLIPLSGTLTVEFFDEGPNRIVLVGTAEIDGLLVDLGKSKRALDEIFETGEQYLKRIAGF